MAIPLVAASGFMVIWAAAKFTYVAVKNHNSRDALKASGFTAPKSVKDEFFGGHEDILDKSGGRVTATVRWLEANEPGLDQTFVFHVGLKHTLIITRDPKVIQQVLVENNYPKGKQVLSCFSNDLCLTLVYSLLCLGDYSTIKPLLGEGLLTSGPSHHTKTSRAIARGFTPSFLSSVAIPIFASQSALLCDTIQKSISSKSGPEKNWVDMSVRLTDLSLDIMALIGFGTSFNFQTMNPEDKEAKKTKEAIMRPLSEPGKLIVHPLRKMRHPIGTVKYKKALEKFRKQLLEVVKKERAGKGGTGSLLQVWIRNGQDDRDYLSDEELVDEIITLLFVGGWVGLGP
jgi:cytochrome P450